MRKKKNFPNTDDFPEFKEKLDKVIEDLNTSPYTRILLTAICGILSETPCGEDRPFMMIPEVTGGNLYLSCIPNVIELVRLSNSPFDRTSSEIKLLEGVKIDTGKKTYDQTSSRLGAIFANLRKYIFSKDDIYMPDCLVAWDIFCELTPESAKGAIEEILSKLFIFSFGSKKNEAINYKVVIDNENTLLPVARRYPEAIYGSIIAGGDLHKPIITYADIKPCNMANLMSALGVSEPENLMSVLGGKKYSPVTTDARTFV